MTIPRNDAELAQMLGVDDRVAYRELEPKALRQEIRGLKEYIKTLEIGPRAAGKASEFILNQFNFDRIHAANI
jgi:hypothetical protein